MRSTNLLINTVKVIVILFALKNDSVEIFLVLKGRLHDQTFPWNLILKLRLKNFLVNI